MTTTELHEILRRLVEKGLVTLNEETGTVKLTPAGNDEIESQLYGELMEDTIE